MHRTLQIEGSTEIHGDDTRPPKNRFRESRPAKPGASKISAVQTCLAEVRVIQEGISQKGIFKAPPEKSDFSKVGPGKIRERHMDVRQVGGRKIYTREIGVIEEVVFKIRASEIRMLDVFGVTEI